jgi:hypothetical protein
VTKPLDPQQLRVRKMIRDARKEGRELERIWVHVDGRVELGFTDANEQAAKVEEDVNPWDKALGHETR